MFVANYDPRVERVTVRDYRVGVSSTVRGCHAGNAGTDDGNPHLRCSPPRRPQLSPTV
jgi:hypothetical protein